MGGTLWAAGWFDYFFSLPGWVTIGSIPVLGTCSFMVFSFLPHQAMPRGFLYVLQSVPPCEWLVLFGMHLDLDLCRWRVAHLLTE